MDHDDAVKLFAVERYVLGEFGQDEAKAFEEHMFGCSECAEQIRLEIEFLTLVQTIFEREGLREPNTPTRKRFCRRPRNAKSRS
jgi:hypothetical protein